MGKIKISPKDHGRRVTCKFNGEKVKDAKLSIKGSNVFVVSNNFVTSRSCDMLGYTTAWFVYSLNTGEWYMDDIMNDIKFNRASLLRKLFNWIFPK